MKVFLILAFLVFPVAANSTSGSGGRGRSFGKPRPVHLNPTTLSEVRRVCEAGWQRFERPSGPWCIRVVNSTVDYADADDQCRSFGGLLSGIQNYAELTYATGEVLRYQKSGSLWIGATRVTACIGQKLGALCTPQTAFQWTDASTTGTVGFNWDVAMPDNNGKQRIQNCALLLASTAPTLERAGVTWQANHVDDADCAGSQAELHNSPRQIFGFICGKRPTLRI